MEIQVKHNLSACPEGLKQESYTQNWRQIRCLFQKALVKKIIKEMIGGGQFDSFYALHLAHIDWNNSALEKQAKPAINQHSQKTSTRLYSHMNVFNVSADIVITHAKCVWGGRGEVRQVFTTLFRWISTMYETNCLIVHLWVITESNVCLS